MKHAAAPAQIQAKCGSGAPLDQSAQPNQPRCVRSQRIRCLSLLLWEKQRCQDRMAVLSATYFSETNYVHRGKQRCQASLPGSEKGS